MNHALNNLGAARWAISAIFFLNGAGIGLWAAHVPVVQARAGLDTGVLGMLLLTIAAGAMAAMPVAGWLTTRWSTRRATIWSTAAFALAIPLLVGTSDVSLLFAAAFAFGASNGALDISMNANASEVETARGTPTMSSFHAFFSLGGLVGAGVGGLAVEHGFGDGRGALVLSVATVIALLVSAPRILPAPAHKEEGASSHFALPRGPALLLGLLALLCMAVEGALVDWSALLLTERTGATAASAALGYSAFSIAMAACRFAGDRLTVRFGSPTLMVVGGVSMLLGLLLAVVSTHYALSAVGFALVGLGAANVVPLIFAAAARIPGMSAGGGVATAATVGYTGLLLGPPVIGWIAAHTSIAVALGALSLAGAVIALNAGIVRGAGSHH
ncbi:MFS transporter [Pseudoduganella buxea]|uniref:MFS transporter n=1 Tax=Pseudoduganella buxea TaxID=1949069 RepID=A0A6I3SS37_9BURK|nr:MFS transporter [Pseudoduganella buxea]MTV51933.1 MFS transporter [Pseudoduganella buxea]GGB97321.1 MFS transporter [Pseudoduganella buxea]